MTSLDAEFGRLIRFLGRSENRRRQAELIAWAPRGLLVGLLAAVAIAAVARLQPLLFNRDVALLSGLLAALGLLIGTFIVLIHRRTLIDQARFADRQFQLFARASSAVEIHEGDLETAAHLKRLQLNDTLRSIEKVEIKSQFPLRLNRRDLASVIFTGALLIVALLVPNPLETALAEKHLLEATVEEQTQALEAVEEVIRQDPSLSAEHQEELLAPIQSALDRLRREELSREEAVATLSESKAELRDLLEKYDKSQLLESLAVAGDVIEENPLAQSLGQSMAEGNFSSSADSLNQLADELPNLNSEQIEELASILSEMSAAFDEMDPELSEQISRAAEALQNNDINESQEAFQESANIFRQRDQEQMAAQIAVAAVEQVDQSRQEIASAGVSNIKAEEDQVTRSLEQDSGQGQSNSISSPGSELGQGEGAGGPGPGGGHVENVYVPEFRDLTGEEGIDVELPANCAGNPENCGLLIDQMPSEPGSEDSLIPYVQVFSEYRDEAYQALEDDHIPLNLRGYVRDYFSSLEP